MIKVLTNMKDGNRKITGEGLLRLKKGIVSLLGPSFHIQYCLDLSQIGMNVLHPGII